ncbi:hypothetical protein MRX96_011653 [Rhipicephalus microplus]
MTVADYGRLPVSRAASSKTDEDIREDTSEIPRRPSHSARLGRSLERGTFSCSITPPPRSTRHGMKGGPEDVIRTRYWSSETRMRTNSVTLRMSRIA